MKQDISLSLVIPARNEEANLADLLQETVKVLEEYAWHFEILVVDDASTDRTDELLCSLEKNSPWLRVLTLRRRSGQSAALWHGVYAAAHPLIAVMDGDGQNDPADLPSLIDTLLASRLHTGNLLVIGHRKQRQDSRVRRWSSRIANGVRSKVLGDGTPDSGCGIKVFSRRDFLCLPRFQNMHRFLPALYRQNGGAVLSVAVSHRPRSAGHSHYGTLDRLLAGLIDLPGVFWLGRRAILATQVKPYPMEHKRP